MTKITGAQVDVTVQIVKLALEWKVGRPSVNDTIDMAKKASTLTTDSKVDCERLTNAVVEKMITITAKVM